MPDLGVLIAAVLSAALGCAVVLLVVGVRGVTPDPTRPPGRAQLAIAALRSPALGGRLAGGVVVGVLVLLLTRWPVAAVGLGALVACWPLLFGGSRAEQLQIDRLEALVVWTESLRDTVSGNASLEQAIPVSALNAPPLIRPALVRMVGQLHARVPLGKALMALATWLDDASADLVLAALILNAQNRGRGLALVLSGLSVAAREELDMRRKVSAGRQGLRRGVQVVVATTIGFALFLSVFGGTYVQPYDTAGGQVALAVVLAIFAVGFGWMRRLAGSSPVMPFLARPGHSDAPEDLQIVAGLTGLSPRAVASLSAQPQAAQPPAAQPRAAQPHSARPQSATRVPGTGR